MCCVSDAVDLGEESSHFANEQSPLPIAFHRLEGPDGLFERSQ